MAALLSKSVPQRERSSSSSSSSVDDVPDASDTSDDEAATAAAMPSPIGVDDVPVVVTAHGDDSSDCSSLSHDSSASDSECGARPHKSLEIDDSSSADETDDTSDLPDWMRVYTSLEGDEAAVHLQV